MSDVLDLSSWKPHEFCQAVDIMKAVKDDKLSPALNKVFDWNSMKIGFNPNSGRVYMFDDDGNVAVLFDEILQLVDEDGNILEDTTKLTEKEKKTRKKKVVINI
jgi:hypothetical protein